MWGPHSVDRFAYSYTTEFARFNSRFFSKSGSREQSAGVPGFPDRTSYKFFKNRCEAEGSIVVPVWKSSYFWKFCLETANDGVPLCMIGYCYRITSVSLQKKKLRIGYFKPRGCLLKSPLLE